MRGISVYFLLGSALGLTGCMGGSPSGSGSVCELLTCDGGWYESTDPNDPSQPNGGGPIGTPPLGRTSAIAMQYCAPYTGDFNRPLWTEGVLVDLTTQEVVWHFRRNDDDTIERTECSDAASAHLMTVVAPPEDWRFEQSILLRDCEPSAVRDCGCEDGTASTRACSSGTWDVCDCPG